MGWPSPKKGDGGRSGAAARIVASELVMEEGKMNQESGGRVGGNIIDGINLEIKSNIMSLTMY